MVQGRKLYYDSQFMAEVFILGRGNFLILPLRSLTISGKYERRGFDSRHLHTGLSSRKGIGLRSGLHDNTGPTLFSISSWG